MNQLDTDIQLVAKRGVCELCGIQGKLVPHHWIDQLGIQYKDICRPCNARLGHMFKGEYPTWEEQIRVFNSHYLDKIRVAKQLLANIMKGGTN